MLDAPCLQCALTTFVPCSQIEPDELATVTFTPEAAETAAELAAVINGAVAPTLSERPTLLGLLAAVRRIRYGGEAGDLGASHAQVYGEPPDLRAELSRGWSAAAGGAVDGDGGGGAGSAGAASGACSAADGARDAAGDALGDAFGGIDRDAAGEADDAFGGIERDVAGAPGDAFGAAGSDAYGLDSDAFGGIGYTGAESAGASGEGNGAGGNCDPHEC